MENFKNMPWPTKKLGEVASVDWGNTSITKKQYVSSGYPAYSATGRDGFLNFFEHEDKTIILSAIGARCGKCFLATGKWTAIKNTIVIKPNKQIADIKYLFYFLDDESKWKQSGAAQPFISEKHARSLEIPLPPLKTQKQIVARIEELFEKIDKAKELRQRAKEETEQIFQSAMAKIFERIEEGYASKMLKELLTQIQYGLSKKMNQNKKGYKIFRMDNIIDYKMNDKNIKYVEISGKEFLKYKLGEGDVLFNRVNSFELVGKTGIFDLSGDYTFASYLIRLQANRKFLNPYFLNYFLNSPQTKSKLRFMARRAVQQANINAKEVSSLEIPLPPLSEQKKIVAYLDNLRKKVDKLKKIQEEQSTDLGELKNSILNKAFSGKLINEKK